MGDKLAREIADAPMSLDDKLSWHLKANHYPAVDDSFIPIAKLAIELAEVRMWSEQITYPNGLVRTVAETIDGLNLQYFME